jgi:hypothetical protein
MADMNELRRLLEMGAITEADFADAMQQQPQNALAEMVRPPVADMPENAMRNEQTGKMTYFAPQGQQGFQDTPYPAGYRAPQSAQPEQKLGEAVEVPGRGVGRYSADQRSVVFQDGSKHDLFPRASAMAAKDAFERAKAMQGLQKGQADIAHVTEQTESSRATRAEQERERAMVSAGGAQIPQALLAKRFGPAPKDMRWKADGTTEAIPGGSVEQGAKSVLEQGEGVLKNIDEMIGQRDPQGKLLLRVPPCLRAVEGRRRDFRARGQEGHGSHHAHEDCAIRGGVRQGRDGVPRSDCDRHGARKGPSGRAERAILWQRARS